MKLFWRAFLFYTGISLALLVFSPLSLLILPWPYRTRYRIINQWSRFVLWWLEKTCQLSYQVQGREHIPDTPVIVMGNHQSAWEAIALTRIFPPQTWVLKRELFWVPLYGWALATLKPIAIDRKHPRRSMRQIIDVGKQRLEAGICVVIFPEGTRLAPGQVKRYGIGGALLAANTGYPVIPVAHNAGEYWPPRSFLKWPGTIQVRIGPKIVPTGKTAQEINALVEEWIEATRLHLRKG